MTDREDRSIPPPPPPPPPPHTSRPVCIRQTSATPSRETVDLRPDHERGTTKILHNKDIYRNHTEEPSPHHTSISTTSTSITPITTTSTAYPKSTNNPNIKPPQCPNTNQPRSAHTKKSSRANDTHTARRTSRSNYWKWH